jgi:hypothetical protein
MVQTAANVIKAINNKAVAGKSVASRAKTSSLIAVKEQTGFIITIKRLVIISLKNNTDIAKIKR